MAIIPVERIERATLSIRGEKVMLDSELAELYGVETRRLNEQVRRNLARFPADFMFQLTEVEKREVVAICDQLAKTQIFAVFALRLPRTRCADVGERVEQRTGSPDQRSGARGAL